ncbi:MAG: hypothetical protein JW995_12875 [Melioribacteraceae bacterium]|nr:hypothetical protein [Melioribacteraceae bacterium]
MKSYFLELFQYNDWANEQLISVMEKYEQFPERCLQLFSHIISVQDVWFERINENHDWNIDIWDLYSIQECKVLSGQSSVNWLKFIRNTKEKDFDKLIKYKSTKGNNYESPVFEICAHVINHSTYHRGQVNQLLAQNGIEVPGTDFIFYTRI